MPTTATPLAGPNPALEVSLSAPPNTALFLLLLIPPVNRPTYASQTIGYIPSVEPKPIVVLASPFRRVTRNRRGAAS